MMLKKRKTNENEGITLVALVVTIVVMLILAGVSISLLVGDNGILNKSSIAKQRTDVASVKELANFACAEIYTDNLVNRLNKSDKEIMDFIASKLNEDGYATVPDTSNGNSRITGISLSEENISLVPTTEEGDKTKDIIVSLVTEDENLDYLVTISGAQHKMTYSNGKIEISEEPIQQNIEYEPYTLTITPTDIVTNGAINFTINGENITTEKTINIVNHAVITVSSTVLEGASKLNFSCNDYNKECTIRALFKNHVCTNEMIVGKQVCACGNIKYIDAKSNQSGSIIYDSENKTIKIQPIFQSGNGYYKTVELVRNQFWNRIYAGYDLYIPNTITSIGSRWICDWGVTANIYYNGTHEEWKNISKDSNWCDLMSARYFFNDKLICTSHDYGDYIVTKEPTNTENGSKCRECKYCKYQDVAIIQKYNQASNFGGATKIDSTNKTITIMPTVEKDGVTYNIVELAGHQFWSRTYAEYTIYIPNTITSIGFRWICDWGVTANVYYDGTKEKWNNISKDSDWCRFMNVNIHCTDGVLEY